MKRTILITTFLILAATGINAQEYSTGIGIRGGSAYGLTIKHFTGERSAFEGILTSRWRGFIITGLYEIHNIAFDVPGLNWYYGFGAHVGFWNNGYNPWFDNNNNNTVLGIDGILGLEYSFADVPFNISLDWKPALNLSGHSGFWGDNGALSVRYIF